MQRHDERLDAITDLLTKFTGAAAGRSECAGVPMDIDSASPTPLPSLGSSPQSSPRNHSISLPSIDLQLRTLVLGNGTVLTYSVNDIPEIPAMSFAKNIEFLATIWDDGHLMWSGTSPLLILGHSIALKHWPKVYRNRGSTQWKALKGRFFDWKVSLSYITGGIENLTNI